MRKGVILEINDLYLTLLTPEGEFLRARKLQQEYQVGEEIHFFPEMGTAKRKKFNLSFLNSFRARTIALAAAFMLAMTAFLPVYQSGQVYAYMSIDVNPSVELAVSDTLKVLRIKGYNQEGKQIIASISDWKKKDAAVVAEMILNEIEEKGFFKEKNDIVIATVHNGKVKKTVDQKLEQKISDIKKVTKEENLDLKVMQGTTEEREKAQEQGLTTGVYKEKLSEEGKPPKKPEAQNAKEDTVKKDYVNPLEKDPVKKVPPGQVKKTMPEQPKVEPAKPTTPGSDKKGNGNWDDKEKNKKNNSNNGQTKSNTHGHNNKYNAKKDNEIVKNNRDHRGNQYQNDRNSNKQQGNKQERADNSKNKNKNK